MEGAGESAANAGTRERFRAVYTEMCRGLIERDEAAQLLLLAALAGEHVLLLGPPGTAKSELARGLRRCVTGGGYFERLLTRFSVPEELFGPLSIKRLENDEYHRLTAGYLPTATVAFLDEIFNANSAILNALLTLLNEREFDNGTERHRTPLATVVAASNQGPDGAELAALHDRFLFRYRVTAISESGFSSLLDLPENPAGSGESPPLPLAPEEIARLREAATGVALGVAAKTFLRELRKKLAAKEIYVSDRRWRKIARVLRIAAAADEREEVTLFDCLLCAHCVWEHDEQREVVDAALRETLDELVSAEPKRHEVLAGAIAVQVSTEHSREEQAQDEEGRPLFVDGSGRIVTSPHDTRPATTSKGEPYFVLPEGLSARLGLSRMTAKDLWAAHFQELPGGVTRFESWIDDPLNQSIVKTPRDPFLRPARFTRDHIAGRARQADDLLTDVESFANAVDALLTEHTQRLWNWEATGLPVAERLREASTSLAGTRTKLRATLEAALSLPERSR